MPGLVSLQSYSVFCAATSAAGVTSTLPQVHLTGRQATTSCCKSALLTSKAGSLSFVEGNSYLDVFELGIVSLPSSSMSVTLSLHRGGVDVSHLLYPSAVVSYSTSSLITTKDIISMKSLSAGSYTISAVVIGLSSSEFSISYIGSTSFTVASLNTEPATPIPVAATFSNSGYAIHITFDSSTNRGGLQSASFLCNTLLNFIGAGTHKCSWSDTSTLVISLSGTTGTFGSISSTLG